MGHMVKRKQMERHPAASISTVRAEAKVGG